MLFLWMGFVQVTNETADVIVNKSLEMWQTQGRAVTHSPIKASLHHRKAKIIS